MKDDCFLLCLNPYQGLPRGRGQPREGVSNPEREVGSREQRASIVHMKLSRSIEPETVN